MFWRVVIGAHQQENVIGELRRRSPDLLPINDEVVTFFDRASLQRGEIGARARLGITLAPDLIARDDLRKIAFLLFLGAPVNQGGAEQAGAHSNWRKRRAGAREFLVVNEILENAGAAAAVFFRPVD